MRDAPALLSHLGSPFVTDATGLTTLIFLRACHAQGTRADHLVSVPQTCEKPFISWRRPEMNSSGSTPHYRLQNSSKRPLSIDRCEE